MLWDSVQTSKLTIIAYCAYFNLILSCCFDKLLNLSHYSFQLPKEHVIMVESFVPMLETGHRIGNVNAHYVFLSDSYLQL